MCNLYEVTSKTDFEEYMRNYDAAVALEEGWGGIVGPFDDGVFMRMKGEGLITQVGQWGLIRPNQASPVEMIEQKVKPGMKPKAPKPRSTNNARSEDIEKKPQFRDAWNGGRRCLIPVAWYQEPNWETGKNIWWKLKRADGEPWMIAGLWSEWVDHATGLVVPNYTMLTVNCNDHPLLNRLHKPELDPETKKPLPLEQQDKRSLVHIPPDQWDKWLHADVTTAKRMLVTVPMEDFDLSVTAETDRRLAEIAAEVAGQQRQAENQELPF
jgi:putative SOS response-associated peptidase YedK